MKRLLLFAIFLLPISGSAQIIPTASGVVTTSDTWANYYTFSFPGYAKFQLADGMGASNSACFGGGSSRAVSQCQSLRSYWDLKNDPNAQWDFGGDSETMVHTWNIANADTSTRHGELKEGPMPVTVTESNNVRVVLTQTRSSIFEFGLSTSTPDTNITMTKTSVFYRHGGAGTGLGASKIYTKTTMTYDGLDGKGPLNIRNVGQTLKASWWKVSGETILSTNTGGCGGYVPYTLAPWNAIYQPPDNTNINKDYVLLAVANANSSTPTHFIPANTCVSPGGSFTGPEGTGGQPANGTIYTCNGATYSGCVSQSLNSAVVKANFLWIEQEQKCAMPQLGPVTFFMGGLRVQTGCATLNQSFPAATPISWTMAAFFGDNGVVDDTTATAITNEYKTPPTMTPTNATGGAFDPVQGYWTLARSSDNVSISANGVLHSPAWLISNWNGASTGMIVGGVTKTLNTDFVATKTDSSHLLVQYLADVASSTTISFPPATADPSIIPANPVVNQGGTINFTADLPGTWACAGTDSSGAGTACAGSINASTGVYTAPASVTAQRSYGGFQLLPNNHVFNTRIDSLGVHASSVSWMQQLLDGSPGGSPGYLPAFPLNYVTNSANTVNMHFFYGAVHDALFTVPSFPNVRIEGGWFSALSNQSGDHHLLQVNTDSGMFSEFYQYYARCTTTAAAVTSNVAKLICSTNPQDAGFLLGRTIQVGSFTGGDTYFNGAFVISAIDGTSISYALTHANASASSNGSATYNNAGGTCSDTGICNSQSGISYLNSSYALPASSTDAAGLQLMPLSL